MSVAEVEREIFERMSEVSPSRRALIERAFGLLPTFPNPRILDVGCGRGGPTIELARLSDGEVVGLDIDERSLATLIERAAREGLSDCIRAVHGSMAAMDFPDSSFDLIWAEASIHAMGFEAALVTWNRFLTPRGCLVIHEMAWLHEDPPAEIADHWRRFHWRIRTVPEYLKLIRQHGYEALGHFPVPGEFWWTDYYVPLQGLLHELRERCAADPAVLDALEVHQREVDIHRKHGRHVGSAYLVLQRVPAERAST